MRKVSTLGIYSAALLLFGTQAAPCLAGDGLSAAPAQVDRERVARARKQLPQTSEEIRAELKRLQTEVLLKENDAQTHYKLGEAYRKLNNFSQASLEYVKAINLDQALWVAYHQLSVVSNDEKQIDEAIDKLIKLEQEKPRELLLRVALSELYEKRGNYYQAARTLIDLTYANAVPEKYRLRVSARIHNMLALSKSSQHEPETASIVQTGEEELDLIPAPLPTQSTKRSIAQAKLKDSKEVRGMGHTNLLP